MLDANTLQWLEDRDALQFMLDQYTLPDGEVSFDDDIRDAAEFEERVANYNPCLSCVDHPKNCPRELSDGDSLGDEIVACRIKHARLAVERQMLREGKGQGEEKR